MTSEYLVDATQIFTLLFVMLGPFGVLAPFAQGTQKMEVRSLRILALKVTALATVTLVGGSFLGSLLLEKWKISTPVMLLTGGIIFFLVALQANLRPYNQQDPEPAERPPLPPTADSLTFPIVVTPFGMAAVIVLVSTAHDSSRMMEIYGLLLAILFLDLLTMVYNRQILKVINPLCLKILFAALGVLQMALAVQIIVMSLKEMQPL